MKSLTSMIAAVLAVAGILAAANGVQAAERYGKQKVVYQINYDGGDSGKAYRAAMQNIQNHINAVGKDNIDVKVVLHGNGVSLLKDAKGNEKLAGQVSGLKSQNVAFNICNNTLVGRKIDAEKDLYEVFKEDIVPSGVAEVSRLQQMGYTYIKP